MTDRWSPADAFAMSEQWSAAEVADYLGVVPSTVTAYKSRGQMPRPDGQTGRTPWWRPETIRAWRPSL